MKINYKIKLRNPVTKNLNISEDYLQTGELTVEKKATGLLLKGSVLKDGTLVKAYTHSFLGESYVLTETDQLTLKVDEPVFGDIEDIFNTLGKDTHSVEFKKIQPFIRKVVKTKNSYKLDVYVEKNSDVFLLKVNSEGIVTRLDAEVVPFTNNLILKSEVSLADTLLYILTSKPLKLDTDGFMFISKQDLVQCPQGFCGIENQVYYKNSNSFETFENYSTLSTIDETSLVFSSSLLVDGIKLDSFNLKAKEKVILQTSDDLSSLNLSNLGANVTLVYEIQPDASLTPYIAVVGIDLDIEYNSSINVKLESLLEADKEFHKKYLFQEYKTLISTKHNQYSIFNSEVLQTLLNTDEFLGRILKYEQ